MPESKEYKWILKNLPTWWIMLLEQEGIPLNFDPHELTQKQVDAIATINALGKLVDSGLVRVYVDPETGAPRFKALGGR